MEENKVGLDLHVFVCTNKRDGKPCCADHNAEKIRAELKEWARENPAWHKRIRINASGCLDHCQNGVAVAIYPDGDLLLQVREGDLGELKAKITHLMNERDRQ